MDVVLLPDYSQLNPYQTELAAGLSRAGHRVSFADRRILPLLTSVRADDADVVHFHWLKPFILDDRLVLTIGKIAQFLFELVVVELFTDTAIVWTVHNRHEHEHRWPTVERWVKRCFVASFCDRLVVHCEAALDVIDDLGLPASVRDRTAVVPHGNYIDVYANDVSKREARERLGIPESETVFLFIGSIRPYKRVPAIIQAFERADVPRGRLLVAGLPWNDEIQQQIRRQSETTERVDAFLEKIPASEFQVYLDAADATVFAFDRDVLTSGSVVLAMSFGRAIVAPAFGCLPETIGERGGILYDPSEEDALPGALEAATELDLAAAGRRNRAVAAAHDWDTVAGQTADIYERARRDQGQQP